LDEICHRKGVVWHALLYDNFFCYLLTVYRRKTSNPKRRMCPKPETPEDRQRLSSLAEKAVYGGNPEHKRNPGDFGLNPPSSPRQAKSLCDDAGIFTRKGALSLLRKGIRLGLVSVQERNGWPQNVWAMSDEGMPLEGMLENAETGSYHAYPMLPHDPLGDEVRERWAQHQ